MKRYSNFVRPSFDQSENTAVQPLLSGEEAKRIYLEEVRNASHVIQSKKHPRIANKIRSTNKKVMLGDISKKDLFVSVENDDVSTLICILDTCPDLLNVTDEYGWSLLMIACQANSVNAAKELVKRGVNSSVRDKAGNSAQSLVIKNRNLALIDILLNCSTNAVKNTEKKIRATKSKVTDAYFCKANEAFSDKEHVSSTVHNIGKSKVKELYFCKACNNEYSDKEEHLSSTVHNIGKSKLKEVYFCEACNNEYSDKEEHLSSTVHNIGKSKLKEVYFCEACNNEYSDKEEHLSSTVHNIGKSKLKEVYFCEACNNEYSDKEKHLSSTEHNIGKSKVKEVYFCEACKNEYSDKEEHLSSTVHNIGKSKIKEVYFCEACNNEYSDKEEHLSSTVHNISASKDKKIPSSYVIPPSNKGFQLMLKVGWDKESGLGRDGSGKKYPIKTVQKKDRKGLGLDKRKTKVEEEEIRTVKYKNRKMFDRECRNSRNLEIDFRRQFY